jgi:D-alanyl-D-alanine carboxypeptidase
LENTVYHDLRETAMVLLVRNYDTFVKLWLIQTMRLFPFSSFCFIIIPMTHKWPGLRLLILPVILIFFFSCSRRDSQTERVPSTEGELTEAELPDLAEAITRFSREINNRRDSETSANLDREAFVEDFWRWIGGEAGLPERIIRGITASALDSPAFVLELLEVLQQDPFTYRLVDKQQTLPLDYEPDDLVALVAGSYRVSHNEHMLRGIAAEALQELAAAAAADGTVLVVGSTYRSATRQAEIYAWQVRTFGQETADRQSAQPGKSQHQLGLVVDFAPIDDSFAQTPASQWLVRNASRFGWSLSYPDGHEDITGYRWESWHYRFVGKDLAAFIDRYFEGIQQFALQFIHTWLTQAE